MRNKRRTDEEWLSLIQECRSSGLPVKMWCQQAQITPSTYYQRERNVPASAETARKRMLKHLLIIGCRMLRRLSAGHTRGGNSMRR